MRCCHIVIWLVLLAALSPAPAQSRCADLLRDINQQPLANPGSGPIGPKVELNGSIYFTATTQSNGAELYRCTASTGSAQLVKDIRPGSSGSDPTQLLAFGNQLWFLANDGTTGDELWVSDGTTQGTRMVKDIDPRTQPPNLRPYLWLTPMGGRIYFAADDSVNGLELWSTDGTTAGTSMVADVNPSGSSQPRGLCVLPGTGGPVLLFACDNGTIGSELWRSDGTAAGTSVVRDINPGSQTSALRYMTAFGGVVAFSAFEPGTGQELWVSDGTSAGTKLLLDLSTSGSSDPRPPDNTYVDSHGESLFAHAGFLYFTARPFFGRGLWRTDGTAAGTLELQAAATTSEFSAGWMIAFGPHVYFAGGRTNSTTGFELWRSDGTVAGTALLVDIAPGSSSGNPAWLTVVASRIFFAANDGATGIELWSSDGTAAGTGRVQDIRLGPTGSGVRGMVKLGVHAIFAADDGIHGFEPWISDGTAAGTKLLADIDSGSGATQAAYIDELTDVAGIVFFEASDGLQGAELWRSDGTAAGTQLVKDIAPGAASSGLIRLTPFAGRVVMLANDGLHGYEPWVSDGTPAGTQLLVDTVPGIGSGYFYAPCEVNGWLYFGNLAELWRTDGTPGGTTMVTSATPMNESVRFGDRIVFQGKDTAHDLEPWVTDGTAAGTFLLKDIYPGNSLVNNFTAPVATDTFVFFGAIGPRGVQSLWRTDGTNAGTVEVSMAVTAYSYATRLGNRVVFRGNNGSPWISDGTAANTLQLAAVTMLSARPVAFGAGFLLFAADDGVHGYELWRTDGTLSGTQMVIDLDPGSAGGFGGAVIAAGTRYAWFAARRPDVGYELWRTDGTAFGTALACDVWPGGSYGVTGKLLYSGGAIFLEADDGLGSNKELFLYFPGATVEPMGRGCALSAPAPILSSSDPVLGTTIQWTARGRPGLPAGYYAAGTLPSAPLELGFGCRVYPDFPWVLIGFVPDPSGVGRLNVLVPNQAALVGGRLVVQAVFGPTATPPIGIDFSNGLLLCLGN